MKILLVDDHVLIREALGGVLRELKPDAEIVEAVDARTTAQRLAEHPEVELILLDLNLPDSSGFDLLSQLRERHPAISVVVLSASEDRALVEKVLELGALGFIPKSAQRAVMLSALNLIFAGGIYIPPEILPRSGWQDALPPAVPKASSALSAAGLGLTQRQMDVLALMMQGKSNKAICRALDLAEATVKNHVTAILRALNASNRTEAVLAAGARGLGSRDGA
jgi:DNA-binding NarL/FixJ family response regulator